MMLEDRNVYSEKLANDVQVKVSSFPFAPHNFKLSYDLDTYEQEKRMNADKLQLKIQEENNNSRLLFEALKLRSRHPLKRPNSANNRPPSGKDANGNTYQTHGKFYHLNFEPIRIEDFNQIEDWSTGCSHVDDNRTSWSPSPSNHQQHSTTLSNVMPNVTDVNNNYKQPACVPIIKNSSFNIKPQSTKLLKITPFISKQDEMGVMAACKPSKKGGSRKLPSLPSALPVSRLSSTVPDLIATTKMPSVAEEIMAVFASEKKKHKLAVNAFLSFTFPHCCSPEVIFGLRNEPENSAQHTMNDLGNPDTIDPVKKYSDLYLNESYIKDIICFKCDDVERVYDRLRDDEEDDEDEEEKEDGDEDATMRSVHECTETSLLSPCPTQLLHNPLDHPPLHKNLSVPEVLQRTPLQSCDVIDSGISLGRIHPTDNREDQRKETESLNNNDNNRNNRNGDMSSSVVGGFTEIESYLQESDATHRGCHKFLPRHPEELAVEIGDGLYVEKEHDDLWCEGINIRTKLRGIFPTAYATDLSLLGEAPKYRQFVSFLGSVQIGQHTGHQVLCRAIKKFVKVRKECAKVTNTISCLQIDDSGIRVSERRKKTATSRIMSRLPLLSSSQQSTDHVFLLKNITFCGILPNNEKYLGFITKHPVCMKFACHVFQAPKSGRPVVEAIGNALSLFHQEFLSVAYPIEDIYFE